MAVVSWPGANSVHKRQGARLCVHEDGSLTIVDPDPSVLPMLQELDPCFTVQQEPLPGFSMPRAIATAAIRSGIARASLASTKSDDLWRAHEIASRVGVLGCGAEASLLELKIELARRMLRKCELCGLRCGVDREAGELGRCGLGLDAFVYEAYVHIAEEPPVNPSLNVSLRGCSLRCRFCQQFPALQPRGSATDVLSAATWAQLDFDGARSLSFVGGNPTESLPSVLEFMAAAPPNFDVPVVWNSAGYDSVEALRLLDGVCDAFIPDCKYGNDVCAEELSRVPGYTSVMRAAIGEMCRQGVPVYVRMLVLPGHANCCHLPCLELLAPYREQIQLNVLSQYMPDFLIRPSDGALARRVSSEEVAEVRDAAGRAGFQLMGADTGDVSQNAGILHTRDTE